MLKELDTLHVYFEIKEGLLVATYKKGLRLNLDMAKTIVKSRLSLMGDKELPVLIYNLGVISMDKEARDYLSSSEGVKGLKAGAIVLNSPYGSFLGNFFLSVTKPPIPARIFTNTKSAMKWLEKFID